MALSSRTCDEFSQTDQINSKHGRWSITSIHSLINSFTPSLSLYSSVINLIHLCIHLFKNNSSGTYSRLTTRDSNSEQHMELGIHRGNVRDVATKSNKAYLTT